MALRVATIAGLLVTAFILFAIGGMTAANSQCATTAPMSGGLEGIYRAAAAKYGLDRDPESRDKGWAILASINKIETDFGRNVRRSSAGAQGWMQFMPATWKRYGVDANHDGMKNWSDPADAIFAAANMLAANGAPLHWHRAIFQYNHAEWYVQDVLNGARPYIQAGRVTDAPDVTIPAAAGPRTAPAAGSRIVAATVFDDAQGYHGDRLRDHPDTYAELGGTSEKTATLLGGLAYGTPLQVTNEATGKSMTLYKRDIGFGQGSKTLKGYRYAIDIWKDAAKQLGLDGSDLVTISSGTPTATASQTCGEVDVGPVRERIVRIAQEEVAKGFEERNGDNCNPYGPCDQWCAMFATWVWEKAGIPIRDPVRKDGGSPWAVNSLRDYGRAHQMWKDPSSDPEPGDLIIFPAHVSIVEKVLPGGQISVIGGNQTDAVTRRTGTPDGVGEGGVVGYVTLPKTRV